MIPKICVMADESAILTEPKSSEGYAMSELWLTITNNNLRNDWLRKGFKHVSFDGIYDKKPHDVLRDQLLL